MPQNPSFLNMLIEKKEKLSLTNSSFHKDIDTKGREGDALNQA